jgi:hypothetical protein
MTAPDHTYATHHPRVRFVLLILAVLCFCAFTLISFGWITVHGTDANGFGWLGLGLALGFASFL